MTAATSSTADLSDIGSAGGSIIAIAARQPATRDHGRIEDTTQRGVLTVRNASLRPASFAIATAPPTFLHLSKPERVWMSIYQASLRVAGGSGSHSFILPPAASFPASSSSSSSSTSITTTAGLTLAAARAWQRPVYVVAGCAREPPAPGVTLFASDYRLLRGGDGIGPAERCVMTMPDGSEATFSDAAGLGGDNDDDDDNAEERLGTISIYIDNSFSYPHKGRWCLLSHDWVLMRASGSLTRTEYPFIGIGAPNPHNMREIVPMVTWDAIPGSIYMVRPNFDTWVVLKQSSSRGTIVDWESIKASNRAITVSLTQGGGSAEVSLEKNGMFIAL